MVPGPSRGGAGGEGGDTSGSENETRLVAAGPPGREPGGLPWQRGLPDSASAAVQHNWSAKNCFSRGKTPTADHAAEIENGPPPQDIKQLQRFLGIVKFYRRFLPNCAQALKPLTDLLKGCGRTAWAQTRRSAAATRAARLSVRCRAGLEAADGDDLIRDPTRMVKERGPLRRTA